MSTANRITKAVVPAAGLDSRLMPASLALPKALFPIVDADGRVRPVMHILIRAAVAAGIEQIAIIVAPGGAEAFSRYFADHRSRPRLEGLTAARGDLDELARLAERITYIVQPRADGFGDAVRCARGFAAGDPVLVMLSDHLYLGAPDALPPTAQVLGAFTELDAASVVGVGVTPVEQLHLHGVVAGDPIAAESAEGLFSVREIVEKPDPDTARSRLVTPGVPPGHFLTHFGLYAFASCIFDVLDEMARNPACGGGELQLTAAQQRLIDQGRRTCAVAVRGRSLDTGTPAELARAQIEMARHGGMAP